MENNILDALACRFLREIPLWMEGAELRVEIAPFWRRLTDWINVVSIEHGSELAPLTVAEYDQLRKFNSTRVTCAAYDLAVTLVNFRTGGDPTILADRIYALPMEYANYFATILERQ